MKFLKLSRLVSAVLALGVMQLALVTGCETRLNEPPPPSPVDPPDILITVVNSAGAAVDAAKVILYKQIEGGVAKHSTVVTGANGQALFENPGVGIYIIFASKTGFMGGTAMWTLSAANGSGPATVKITALAELPDVGTGTYTASDPTISTVPLDTLLTADSIFVTPGSSITIVSGTDEGSSVSVSNPSTNTLPSTGSLVALTGIVVTGTADGTKGTVSLGLPFTLPTGTQVPIYRYNETTESWEVVGTGSVGTDGNLSGSVTNLSGILSALANFTPTRNQLLETLIKSVDVEPLGASTYNHPYTPTLDIERADEYSRTERDWIKATVQGITGLVYGKATVISASKPDGQGGTFDVWQVLDRYTINVNLGESRPTRGAATIQHHAQTRSRFIDWNTGHFSTTSGT